MAQATTGALSPNGKTYPAWTAKFRVPLAFVLMGIGWWGWNLYHLTRDKNNRFYYPDSSKWWDDLAYSLSGLALAVCIIAFPFVWISLPFPWWGWTLQAVLVILYLGLTISFINRD